MYVRMFGLDAPLLSSLPDIPYDAENGFNGPIRTFVCNAKAMASTPADVQDRPNAYVFIINMTDLKLGGIKVQVEDENVLVISGRGRGRTIRRVGKFMCKFSLPKNADTEKVTVVRHDGVLTVTVGKVSSAERKKPKTIEVQVA